MKKEKVLNVIFNKVPDVKVRVISDKDSDFIKKNKKKYPFKLTNSIKIKIITSKRLFDTSIWSGFIWNGADIPRVFWRLIGSRTDNDFLVASMVHDYLLEFKAYIMKDVLQNSISMREYRRLTSLIFRHIIKSQGTSVIKANIMAWCVDIFQIFNKRSWKCQ